MGTVSFYKLGLETLDDGDLPQKVVEWAETVKQRLREEEGVQMMVDLDGEEGMRGIWAWVCQAWGVSDRLSLHQMLSSHRTREDILLHGYVVPLRAS